MATPREPVWSRPVTYGAVGATRAEDLLKFPPKGYRPLERRVRIGHGPERWHHAWVETMSFGLHRRAGVRVRRMPAPDEAVENAYRPVAFDETGEPVRPASRSSGETVYADTGEELVRAGDGALLMFGWRALSVRVPVRVVYVIDEPNRRGFGTGTLPGHPLDGEEAFIVERRDDDSVWLTIRAFSRPAHPALWPVVPVLRGAQAIVINRYEHALTGPLG